MYACVQSRLYFPPLCLQVRAGAASLCAPQIEISIAGSLPMARTCVSHYSKLQILHSKKLNVPLSLCNFQCEEEAVAHLQNPAELLKQGCQTLGPEARVACQRLQSCPMDGFGNVKKGIHLRFLTLFSQVFQLFALIKTSSMFIHTTPK